MPEFLSYSYLIIDLILISFGIYTATIKFYYFFVFLVVLVLYPFLYEPFLKCVLTILDKMFKGIKQHPKTHLEWSTKNCLVYNPVYNISVCGIEKKHPFDARKSERVTIFLSERLSPEIIKNSIKTPSPNYKFLYSQTGLMHLILLNYSIYLSKIVEIPIFFLPASLLRVMALRRFLYHNQGSLIGSCVALEKGFAINLGGGMHHAHTTGASGFCFYNDIGLVVKNLWRYHSHIKNVLIVDLDAHQGNGHARDKLLYGGDKMKILDIYNPNIFPHDNYAKTAIDIEVLVNSNTDDDSYINKLENALEQVHSDNYKPDFIIYNAGTDILEGDRLG